MIRTIRANYVDVIGRRIFAAELSFNKKIVSVRRLSDGANPDLPYCTPGLVDAHVHIESSMLTPQRFATMVIPHGTVAVVCDPHEIANVLGERGVEFMMADAERSPLRFYFAIPSCVPSTPFETNGAEFGPEQIERLMSRGVALAEMMNYPGLLAGDPKMLAEMEIAKRHGKPVDGHIPGVTDSRLADYVAMGVSTDHESFTLAEAKAKLSLGMKILIREGSAARNLDALVSLFRTDPGNVMACTDDAHPDDIRDRGHIDKFYRRARLEGADVFDIFKVLTLNPVRHYGLDVGLLREGDNADFLILNDLDNLTISASYIGGVKVYDREVGLNYNVGKSRKVNNFIARTFSDDDFKVVAPAADSVVRVIELVPDQLVTRCAEWRPPVARAGDEILSSAQDDVMKIAVVNRYNDSPVVNGFIRGTGMVGGAMASSIAHDSHNVVVIGADSASMRRAAEEVFSLGGGIAVVAPGGHVGRLHLPIAGLMTTLPWDEVAARYERLSAQARVKCGVRLKSPFMTMAFMSLLVIPSLKIGDKGLFDVDEFKFVSLFA